MMDNHLVVPLLSALFSAIFTTLFARQRVVSRWLFLLCCLTNLIYATWLLVQVAVDGRQVLFVGGWSASLGVTLVADRLSALVLVLAVLLLLAAFLFNLTPLDRRQHEQFFFYPLLLVLLLGICGVVLTGDLFNFFIWYEVQVLAAVGLLTLGGGWRQMAGGLSYSMINLLGSVGFLAACGLLYGLVGSLNMALVSERIEAVYTTSPELVAIVVNLLLLTLATKAAVVPLSFWVPDTVHTPPVAVGMLLGGILTSTGFYGLYRMAGLMYSETLPIPSVALLLLAILTILVGVLGALGQVHIRRIIAFLLLAQAGYVLLGLGLASEMALTASLLFLLHDTLLLSALLCLCGTIELLSKTSDIRQMGGVVAREPGLALVWFVAFVSLVGVLPVGGFFARLTLLQAMLSVERYLMVLLIVGTTLLSILPLLKIWHEVFWKVLPADAPVPRRAAFPYLVPGLFLVVIVLLSGLGMAYVVDYSASAAQQVLDAPAYVADVLGRAAGE